MDSFGEYMFSLLFAPLKRAKRASNQFYIFFKIVGTPFDDLKQQVFKLREESSILTCSDEMLVVHGQDRDMPRLKGESLEGYRTRLAMQGIIAKKAGTNEGIRYLAKAFGYDNVEIEPSYIEGHWAEAIVRFIGGDIVLDDRELLLQELNRIKPARTILHLAKEQQYTASLHLGASRVIARQMTISQE